MFWEADPPFSGEVERGACLCRLGDWVGVSQSPNHLHGKGVAERRWLLGGTANSLWQKSEQSGPPWPSSRDSAYPVKPQRRGEGGMSAARKEMRVGTNYKALSAVRVFMCVCRAGGKQSIQVHPHPPTPRKGAKLTRRGADSGKKRHSQSEGNFQNAPRNEEGWTVLSWEL